MGRQSAVAQGGAPPAPKAPAEVEGAAGAGKTTRNCLHKQLRKTKFCMFHLQGTCQFGKDCAFAHSLAEMNGTPDLRKTQLCKAFAAGRCDDPTCNFAHGEVELRSTDMFFKKSLCIWNEKGKCRNDSQCRFAHGLAELRAHQAGQRLAQLEEQGVTVEPPPQGKGGRRRKGKQSQHPMAGLCMDLPQVQVSSSQSTSSGSSSDRMQRQSSDNTSFSRMQRQSSDNTSYYRMQRQSSDNTSQATEPMKVQPQSISPQEPTTVVPDGFVSSLFAESQMLSQQQQHLQRQLQDTLAQRLGGLEEDYLAMEAARWQQQLNTMAAGNNRYNPDLQADLDSLRKGIGMLAAHCSQIQQRMQPPVPQVPQAPKISPYMATSGLQNSSIGKPYPNAETVQQFLWQLQMQVDKDNSSFIF